MVIDEHTRVTSLRDVGAEADRPTPEITDIPVEIINTLLYQQEKED